MTNRCEILLVIGMTLAMAFSSNEAHGQMAPESFKVRSIHSSNFDQESIRNFRRLSRIANRDGRIMVWTVTNAPYDATVEPLSEAYDAQNARLSRFKEQIIEKLELSKTDVQSVADGPFFAADVDSSQLRKLIRMRVVKGFWGFTNAGYVTDGAKNE